MGESDTLKEPYRKCIQLDGGELLRQALPCGSVTTGYKKRTGSVFSLMRKSFHDRHCLGGESQSTRTGQEYYSA